MSFHTDAKDIREKIRMYMCISKIMERNRHDEVQVPDFINGQSWSCVGNANNGVCTHPAIKIPPVTPNAAVHYKPIGQIDGHHLAQ